MWTYQHTLYLCMDVMHKLIDDFSPWNQDEGSDVPFPLHLLTSPLKTSWQLAVFQLSFSWQVAEVLSRTAEEAAAPWLEDECINCSGVIDGLKGRHYKLSLIWSVTDSPFRSKAFLLLSEFVSSCKSCSKLADDRCIQGCFWAAGKRSYHISI